MNRMHLVPSRTSACVLALGAFITAALLVAAPAEANMLARGTVVGGTFHTLKKNLGDLADQMGEMAGAVIEGDDERARQVWQEVRKTPWKIARDAVPVFKTGAETAEQLQAANRKIRRFAGGAVADARAALAGGESTNAILDGEAPLLPKLRRSKPAAAAAATGWDAAPKATAASTAPRTGAWDDVTQAAEDRKRQAWLEEQRRKDSRPARWEAARKEAEQLEAEEVRRYANDYWARREPDANARPNMESLQPGTFAYDNYREMMHAEGWADSGSAAPDDYSAALAGLPDEEYGVVEDDYQAALGEIEEREAEQKRRAEAEERRRQAALEEQKRRAEEAEAQRQAELERQRLEEAEAQRQAELERQRRREARDRRRAEERAGQRREAAAERRRQAAIEQREARNRAARRQQVFDDIAESMRQYNEQMQRAIAGGSQGGRTSGDDRGKTWIGGCTAQHPCGGNR
ncbi:MAG: hypothetical protein F4Y02_15410 [Chloroflexi bacterium]|nr:hypothetical protein [Chloroflexota bacterium]